MIKWLHPTAFRFFSQKGILWFGCQPKNSFFSPQIIHLFIGFSIIYKPSILGVNTPYFWKHPFVVISISVFLFFVGRKVVGIFGCDFFKVDKNSRWKSGVNDCCATGNKLFVNSVEAFSLGKTLGVSSLKEVWCHEFQVGLDFFSWWFFIIIWGIYWNFFQPPYANPSWNILGPILDLPSPSNSHDQDDITFLAGDSYYIIFLHQ